MPTTLDESTDKEVIEAYARLVYAKTIIESSLLHKDAWDNVNKIKEIRNMFSANAKINKYYVKCLLQGESRQSLNDTRVSYLEFKEAEKINKEIL